MKRLNILLIFLFVVLIGFVLFLFSFNDVQNSPEVREYTYTGPGGEYLFRVDEKESFHVLAYQVYATNFIWNIPFDYGPEDLENLTFEEGVKGKVVFGLNGKLKEKIYLTQDPDLPGMTQEKSVIAVLTLSRIVGTASPGIYGIDSETALTRSIEESDLPEINCDSADSNVGVIRIELGEENKIYSEGECVVLQGKDAEGIIKSATKLSYILLDVF